MLDVNFWHTRTYCRRLHLARMISVMTAITGMRRAEMARTWCYWAAIATHVIRVISGGHNTFVSLSPSGWFADLEGFVSAALEGMIVQRWVGRAQRGGSPYSTPDCQYPAGFNVDDGQTWLRGSCLYHRFNCWEQERLLAKPLSDWPTVCAPIEPTDSPLSRPTRHWAGEPIEPVEPLAVAPRDVLCRRFDREWRPGSLIVQAGRPYTSLEIRRHTWNTRCCHPRHYVPVTWLVSKADISILLDVLPGPRYSSPLESFTKNWL